MQNTNEFNSLAFIMEGGVVSITVADSEGLNMDEYGAINEYFQEMAGNDALLKCGISLDPELGDKVSVTVIATGFEKEILNTTYQKSAEESKTVIDLNSSRNVADSNQKSRSFGTFLEETSTSFEPVKVIETQNGVFSKTEDKIDISREYPKPNYQQPNSQPQSAPQYGNAPYIVQQASLFDEQPVRERVVYLDNQKIEEEQKREMLIRAYREREQRLNNHITSSSMKPDDFKERLEVPAYVRMGKNLQDVPHSSERVVSRFSLSEDNDLLGNNKFLHDNVD